LWYPVLGAPKVRLAPDTLVAFGRPKGYRGSYKQWEEENIPPQVVFEVLSPSNSVPEMIKKHAFYEKYGVEEFIIINPEINQFYVWVRNNGQLKSIELKEGSWTSKKLGIHIKRDSKKEELVVTYPDGRAFMDHIALHQMAEQERKEKEALLAENERLKAKLRELGLLDE